MKAIINKKDKKLFIDFKDISVIKTEKKAIYYIVEIILKSGQKINFECDETEINEVIERLKS